MLDYTGIKCPVCDVPFRKEDDIVVCPQCGAPHHRSCYQQEGKCALTETLHAQGKTWSPPEPPAPPDLQTQIKDQECPSCGKLNAHSALFCNFCGHSLLGDAENSFHNRPLKYGEAPAPQDPEESSQNQNAGTFLFPFPFDPMGGVRPTESLDEKVLFGDVSKLVRQNTAYYLPVFRNIKKTGRNKFNFSAFLCSGPWLLYRKQYKSGAIITALVFLLYLSSTFLSTFVSVPILYDLMQEVGVDMTTLSPTLNQWMEISRLLAQDGVNYLKFALPSLCLLAMLILMIAVGLRGNKMYMNHCIKTIQTLKAEEPNPEHPDHYKEALETKGGVNIGIGICMFVCYIIVSNISIFL